MIYGDLIERYAEVLTLLGSYGITPTDVKALPVFTEYKELKSRGFKMTFIAEYLAQKYRLSVAGVYRVIKRFNRTINC